MTFRLALVLITFWVMPAMAYSQVRPRKSFDRLLAIIDHVTVFDSTVLSNLHAGIPLAVILQIRLVDQDSVIASHRSLVSVAYDVWNRRYDVIEETTPHAYNSVDSLLAYFHSSRSFSLTDLSILRKDRPYCLRLRVRVQTLPEDNVDAESWLRKNVDQDSISGLFPFQWIVRHIFGRGNPTIFDTSWIQSESFTIQHLATP